MVPWLWCPRSSATNITGFKNYFSCFEPARGFKKGTGFHLRDARRKYSTLRTLGDRGSIVKKDRSAGGIRIHSTEANESGSDGAKISRVGRTVTSIWCWQLQNINQRSLNRPLAPWFVPEALTLLPRFSGAYGPMQSLCWASQQASLLGGTKKAERA